MKEKVLTEMKRIFRPEFLNRVDSTLVFHTLTKPHIREIVDLMLKEIDKQVALKGINLEVTAAARDWLGEKGYDPVFGARPLRRVIQERMEDSLSEALLRGEFDPGDTIKVDIVTETNDAGAEETKLDYIRVPGQLAESVAAGAGDDASPGDSPSGGSADEGGGDSGGGGGSSDRGGPGADGGGLDKAPDDPEGSTPSEEEEPVTAAL